MSKYPIGAHIMSHSTGNMQPIWTNYISLESRHTHLSKTPHFIGQLLLSAEIYNSELKILTNTHQIQNRVNMYCRVVLELSFTSVASVEFCNNNSLMYALVPTGQETMLIFSLAFQKRNPEAMRHLIQALRGANKPRQINRYAKRIDTPLWPVGCVRLPRFSTDNRTCCPTSTETSFFFFSAAALRRLFAI